MITDTTYGKTDTALDARALIAPHVQFYTEIFCTM